MAEAVLFIHGYGAEGRGRSQRSMMKIYGDLPQALQQMPGGPTISALNISRYISLEDGVRLDDLSLAMDRAIRREHPKLLKRSFSVVCHSTGALVVRNWLRLFSPKPSPLKRLIELGGANFGSGWAHVGRSQLARWGRAVLQSGTERGVQVLSALEFGSTESLDTQVHFTRPGYELREDYEVRDFSIVGTSVLSSWIPIPVRYAHEDGSDGVVRVCSANPEFNYLEVTPHPDQGYRVHQRYVPANLHGYAHTPIAVPYQCAHTGRERGVLKGKDTRAAVLALLQTAMKVKTEAAYRRAADTFRQHTTDTRVRAARDLKPGPIRGLLYEPRAQYDEHAQIIFRVRDEQGRVVEDPDLFFASADGRNARINALFEHAHTNRNHRGTMTFYLRLRAFDDDTGGWVDRMPDVGDVRITVHAEEKHTSEISYEPLDLRLSNRQLRNLVMPNTTTVLDVTLRRVPSADVFRIRRL